MPKKYRRRPQGAGFPQYDDAAHIDSAAVAPPQPAGAQEGLRGDPDATAYTEQYCTPPRKK